MDIVYGDLKYLPSFQRTIDVVAREEVYVEMIQAPTLEKMEAFHGSLIKKNAPMFFALDGEKVVGWCDISPIDNPRQCHRGRLGMGLLPNYRQKGIGSMLLEKSIAHCPESGIEKIELEVYADNPRAIALYKKYGFVEEGRIEQYRKLNGRAFTAIVMAKFLT